MNSVENNLSYSISGSDVIVISSAVVKNRTYFTSVMRINNTTNRKNRMI